MLRIWADNLFPGTHYTATLFGAVFVLPHSTSILLGPQSRSWDKPLNFQVVRPSDGTAVLTGFQPSRRDLREEKCRRYAN